MSKSAFQLVSTTSEPFYCPHCALSLQRKEIITLKASVDQLFSKEIVFLKSTISQLTSEISSLKEKLATVAPHNSTNSHPRQNWSVDPANPPAVTPQQNTPTQHTSVSNRRFNVVISGIFELPKGSSRYTRNHNDFKAVSSIISEIETHSNHSSSIRDCRRLGRYDETKPSPRPILVSLISTADVSNILACCHHLKQPISIKPDLSPPERKIRVTLLHERWKLINSGTDRSSIKLRNSSIFINGHLYGKVTNGIFSLSPTLSDSGPKLTTTTDTSDSPLTLDSQPNKSSEEDVHSQTTPITSASD